MAQRTKEFISSCDLKKEIKTCSRCKINKSFNAFGKDSRSLSGLQSACLECCAQSNQIRREADPEKARSYVRAWTKANPEKKKASDRAWAEANPEKARLRFESWREANLEQFKATARLWREANSIKVAATVAAYRKANPDRIRAYQIKRRATKKSVLNTLTYSEWIDILASFQGLCFWCGSPWEHRDHIVPLSKGGPHTKGNVVPACASCNQRKSAKDPLVFFFENHATRT